MMDQPFEDSFFFEMEKLFYFTGFNMRSKSKNFKSWLRIIVSMLVVSLSTVQLLLEAAFTEGLIYSTEPLVSAIIIFNAAIKIFAIFVKEDVIISSYKLINERVVKAKSVKWKNAILNESRNQVEKIQNFFVVNFSVCVVGALLNSAVMRYFNPENGLPLKQWFPFDTSTTAGFIAGFCYQTFTTSTGVIIFTFSYMTFCGLVLHTSALMKLLNIDIRNVLKRTDDGNGYELKIRSIISDHMTIIRLVKSINEVFGNVLLLEILLSSLQSCLVAYQCSERPLTDPKQGFFIPFLLCTTIVPYAICWCGELLKTSSLELSGAVYESNWEDLDPKARSDMLFVLRQTSKPLVLSAKNTFTMDMETFLKTIQTAYSYLAMLRSVDK